MFELWTYSLSIYLYTYISIYLSITWKYLILFLATGSKCTPPYVSIDSKCYYFSSEKASWNKAYVSLHVYFWLFLWYGLFFLISHLLYELVRIKGVNVCHKVWSSIIRSLKPLPFICLILGVCEFHNILPKTSQCSQVFY